MEIEKSTADIVNNHRSFSRIPVEVSHDEGLELTRTSRARDAVKKAKEIVSRNNMMVDELKKRGLQEIPVESDLLN